MTLCALTVCSGCDRILPFKNRRPAEDAPADGALHDEAPPVADRYADAASGRETGPDQATYDASPQDDSPRSILPLDGASVDAVRSDAGPRPDAKPPDSGPPPAWVTLSPGTFQMGAVPTEACYLSNESPKHTVTLTHAFEIAVAETTQAEFQSLMGKNPSSFSSCGPTCPVDSVSWFDAAAYCNALSKSKGLVSCYTCTGSGASLSCSTAASFATGNGIYSCKGYRLPTEAEWEYAYRAGTQTGYYNGNPDPADCAGCTPPDPTAVIIAWFECNAGGTTHPVKQRKSNGWGLFDMAGNAAEWCHDSYGATYPSGAVTDPVVTSGNFRVIRGGSWWNYARTIRAAARSFDGAGKAAAQYGFRCARSL